MYEEERKEGEREIGNRGGKYRKKTGKRKLGERGGRAG